MMSFGEVGMDLCPGIAGCSLLISSETDWLDVRRRDMRFPLPNEAILVTDLDLVGGT